jgi:peroxiredoxin
MANAVREAPPAWPPSDPQVLISFMYQGPVSSSTQVFALENMLHSTPLAGRSIPPRVAVGEPMPDFTLVDADGATRTLADFRGRPLVLRFSRAVSELLVCPLCLPGLEELKSVYDDFEASGIELAVLFSTAPDVTARIGESLGLTYPLYSDFTWSAYHGADTGHVFMAPRQAWAIIDADGILRWAWRVHEDGDTVAMPSDVLRVARDLFGS